MNVKEQPSLRLWFNLFVQLRNKARGHGAPSPARLSSCVESLEISINHLVNNLPLQKFDWSYLHRNLSGKYRVVDLTEGKNSFDVLKKSEALKFPNLTNGIYIWLSGPRRVNLIYADQDCVDFFFPNGDFKQNNFEVHSLLSDDRRRETATAYLTAPSLHPKSQTEGSADLNTVGSVFTNIPSQLGSYIQRPKLQKEMSEVLTNDRHPIVTLVGRGGIGKTSLALRVLHDIAFQSRFDLIAWFSSRDIDLIGSGAKQVRPAVLTEKDISEMFRKLVGEPERNKEGKKVDAVEFMSNQLGNCDFGPSLFVFDNFETLRNPQDVYAWIDTNVRLPNKVLITSRFRDFRGDFPIEIPGMEPSEAAELASETARNLGIETHLRRDDVSAILDEAEGHPYVIKILLGEIADKGVFSKPSALLARRDDVLNALFERTFTLLSPLASRIFLTLARWRSSVPQLVMEAALLRHSQETINPEGAIDQLIRMSLIERSTDSEGVDHLSVPISASIFGREKLEVAAARALIIEDVRFLQILGAADVKTDARGLMPRLERLFAEAAKRIEMGEASLQETRPVLEFLARGYSKAWLLLSRFEQDTQDEGWEIRAAEFIRRFLQADPNGAESYSAWRDLETLYRKQGDAIAACGAFIRTAEISDPPLERLSALANWLNSSVDARQNLAPDERAAVFLPLAHLMERLLRARLKSS